MTDELRDRIRDLEATLALIADGRVFREHEQSLLSRKARAVVVAFEREEAEEEQKKKNESAEMLPGMPGSVVRCVTCGEPMYRTTALAQKCLGCLDKEPGQ